MQHVVLVDTVAHKGMSRGIRLAMTGIHQGLTRLKVLPYYGIVLLIGILGTAYHRYFGGVAKVIHKRVRSIYVGTAGSRKSIGATYRLAHVNHELCNSIGLLGSISVTVMVEHLVPGIFTLLEIHGLGLAGNIVCP